jgi:hypothetical protein
MELGKVMEEAFNRSSVGSSVRSITENYQDTSQYDSPPTSFSNTRNSGGSTLATTPGAKTLSMERPLPPIPSETPNTFLQRKLAETRADIARRLNEDGDTTEHFNKVLEHLDRLIVPAGNGKRTVSAPAKPLEHTAPLHVIPEERADGGGGFDAYHSHYRAVTDPIRVPARFVPIEQQQTIRIVEGSPTRIAPLNIRKRSGASLKSTVAGQGAVVTSSRSTDSSTTRPHQDAQNHHAVSGIEKHDTMIKKKKSSLWFRRNTEEKERDQDMKENQIKKKQSTALLQIPEAWQGLDDSIKNGSAPTNISKYNHQQSDGSSGSEFPMRNTSSATAKTDSISRKGFFGFFGKKTKEDKGRKPMELGGKHEHLFLFNPATNFCLAINFSSSSILSNYDLGPESNDTTRAGPPEIQMNWLSRFLHIKPANKTLCFQVGRGKVRQDLIRLLRDWQRFGVHDVSLDREANAINARIDKNNRKYTPSPCTQFLFSEWHLHGRRFEVEVLDAEFVLRCNAVFVWLLNFDVQVLT